MSYSLSLEFFKFMILKFINYVFQEVLNDSHKELKAIIDFLRIFL
jgi:hypothetical protein